MCAPGIVAHISRQITEVSSQVSYITFIITRTSNIKVWHQAEIKLICSYKLVVPTQERPTGGSLWGYKPLYPYG
jgi:hypothetical protein